MDLLLEQLSVARLPLGSSYWWLRVAIDSISDKSDRFLTIYHIRNLIRSDNSDRFLIGYCIRKYIRNGIILSFIETYRKISVTFVTLVGGNV